MLLSGGVFAQSGIGVRIQTPTLDSVMTFEYEGIVWNSVAKKSSLVVDASTKSIIRQPSIYDFHALGMFCKFDVGLDKGSKIPLRFRLGTVGGVDTQERKGPTRYNY